MKDFPRQVSVVQMSRVWQRASDGQWERYMVRQLENGVSYWSLLIPVNTGQPVCLHCLSNNVKLDPNDIEDRLFCLNCRVTYTIV
jgi:hypothetical protein